MITKTLYKHVGRKISYTVYRLWNSSFDLFPHRHCYSKPLSQHSQKRYERISYPLQVIFILILRNNYDLWSAIPGKNNFQYKRQYTIYKLMGIKDNEVQLKTGPTLNYTIDRNISWTELIDSVFKLFHE